MTDPSRRDQHQERGATDPSRSSPEAPDEVEDDGPVSHQVEDARDEVVSHWSEQRRRRAVPRDRGREPPDGGEGSEGDVPGEGPGAVG